MKRYMVGVSLILIALTLAVPLASATTITITTPLGSTAGGKPVDASAVFTTGAGTLTITLTNLQVNPLSVVQNLSGLSFVLSSGQVAGSLTSSSGLLRTIASNQTYADGSVVDTGWVLRTSSGLMLDDLGAGASGPAHTIIGPPGYSSANSSIAGNGPHNPFLAGDVTFNLSIQGLTARDTVTSATFYFGTDHTLTDTIVPSGGPGPTVPEPTSLLLLGSGLVGLAVWRYKK